MDEVLNDAELVALATDDPLLTATRFDTVYGFDWRRLSKTQPAGMGSQIDAGFTDGKTVLLVRNEDREILQAYLIARVVPEQEVRVWYAGWVRANLTLEPLD